LGSGSFFDHWSCIWRFHISYAARGVRPIPLGLTQYRVFDFVIRQTHDDTPGSFQIRGLG
jgi:hypothetical protein